MAYDPLSGRYPDFGSSATAALGGASSPAPSAPPSAEKKPLDDSDQRIKDFNAKQDQLSTKLDTVRADTAAKNEKLEDFFSKNQPPVYKPPEPYKAPEKTNALEAWGSLAMVFAMLASHFTRTPMTTAMNAGAAVMNALKQKDVEAAQSSYQQWKDANTQALDLAKYQQAAYANLMQTIERREKNNIELSKDATADIRAQALALSVAFKDTTMAEMLQQKEITAAKTEYDRRQKEIDMMEIQSKKLEQGWEKMQGQIQTQRDEAEVKATPEFKAAAVKGDEMAMMAQLAAVNPDKYTAKLADLQEKKQAEQDKQQKYEESAQGQAAQQFREWKAQNSNATPEEQNKKEAEFYGAFKSGGSRLYPPITPENKGFLSQQFASYELKPPTDAQLGRQPDMLSALEEAKKINPNYNPAKYDAIQAARKKITSGKDSDAIASYVRLDQHLDFFKGLVEKLSDGSDIKTLNALARTWGVQTGNSNVTSYETALQLVGDEMVKAATGTGAAGALGDREEIKKNFDPSLDKAQLRANINAVQVLVGGALVSTLNKYKNVLTPQELTDAVGSREVMEHFHVSPDTLQPVVEGAYNFGGKQVEVGPQGATSKEPQSGAMKIGSAVNPKTGKEEKTYSANGKTVFGDGTPLQ